MAFPTTSVLDAFGTASQLLSARAGWDHTNHLNTGDKFFETNSGGTALVTTPGTPASSYWGTSCGPDCEVGCDLTAVDSTIIHLGMTFSAGVAVGGYGFRMGFGGTWDIETYSTASLASGSRTAPSAGDSIGFSRIGSVLTAYIKHSGTWSVVGSVTDATYTGAGEIGIAVGSGNTPTIDNFFGGTAVAAAAAKASGIHVVRALRFAGA